MLAEKFYNNLSPGKYELAANTEPAIRSRKLCCHKAQLLLNDNDIAMQHSYGCTCGLYFAARCFKFIHTAGVN